MEFALVLPFLVLVIFGVIAYGFVFSAQLSINNAARDAARAGVVQPLAASAKTCSEIATVAKNNSSTIGLTGTRVKVQVTTSTSTCTVSNGGTVTGSGTAKVCTGTAAGDQLTVVVTYANVKVPVPMAPGLLPSNLQATGKFQCEYS